MKKILFIYPHNFLECNMGTNIRVYSLAKELHSQGYNIDLYALSNFVSSFYNFNKTNKKDNLINTLYLYDYNETVLFRKKNKLQKAIRKYLHGVELENWVTPAMIKQFNKIVSFTEYDYVVMFYAYTAELLSPTNYTGNACKIYFMEDILSISQLISGKNKHIGRMLDNEIKRLSYFDKLACISSDEKVLFEKLLPQKSFYFLPHLISRKNEENKITNKIIKILFIGYNNEYNIKGMQWFLDEVYPHLAANLEIIVVGKVTNYINNNYPNLKKIEYADNLNDLYMGVDVVICPLKNGTGMKIKVIEAMSYGIPIVCTSRGVDGFPDKNKNGCLVEDLPENFAKAINMLATDTSFYHRCQKEINKYFSEVLDSKIHKNTIKQLFD